MSVTVFVKADAKNGNSLVIINIPTGVYMCTFARSPGQAPFTRKKRKFICENISILKVNKDIISCSLNIYNNNSTFCCCRVADMSINDVPIKRIVSEPFEKNSHIIEPTFTAENTASGDLLITATTPRGKYISSTEDYTATQVPSGIITKEYYNQFVREGLSRITYRLDGDIIRCSIDIGNNQNARFNCHRVSDTKNTETKSDDTKLDIMAEPNFAIKRDTATDKFMLIARTSSSVYICTIECFPTQILERVISKEECAQLVLQKLPEIMYKYNNNTMSCSLYIFDDFCINFNLNKYDD